MKQYQIENIKDDLPHEIVLPEVWEQNKFSELTFTNTRATGAITLDLYVKDVIFDSAGLLPIYYLLRNVVIPNGVSLTVGVNEIPYLKENVRSLWLTLTNDGTGSITLIIR